MQGRRRAMVWPKVIVRGRACGFRACLTFAVLTLLSSRAVAQPALNPTRAEFSPSVDHNSVVNGTPVVSSYTLDLFLQGAPAPFQSVPLGKPNPDPDGTIRVDLTSQFVGWPVPGTVYVADVAAVGPGGTAPSAQSNTFTFGNGCAYSLSPTNPSATSAGGPASVSVTAGAGCAWTAASNAAWVTVNAGGSGTGNGTVNYSVAANTGTSSRTGTMTVAGQTVTVTQAASVPTCTFNVSPTNPSATSAGGPASLTVTAGQGCGWTATRNANWITVTSGASGTGNGTVNYTVAANTSTSTRTGTLTVAGLTVTVTQTGTCNYTVSPTNPSATAAGGSRA